MGENSSWGWPDELDALVAAPQNHHVLLENDQVRVIQTQVPVGATTPVHTHRWASVEYVLSTTDFIRRDGDGDVMLDTRADDARPGLLEVLWSGPRPPHSIENVGEYELRVLMVELKDPARQSRDRAPQPAGFSPA
jgi:quercetin dioxygenase-like cupin family protein